MNNIKVIINNKEYELTIENNETTKSFLNLLPLTLDMKELNGNEKYYYLSKTITSNPKQVNEITKGDVMLYNDNCLVLFYDTFKTSYSYTKIGHISNLPSLNNDNLTVTFTKGN